MTIQEIRLGLTVIPDMTRINQDEYDQERKRYQSNISPLQAIKDIKTSVVSKVLQDMNGDYVAECLPIYQLSQPVDTEQQQKPITLFTIPIKYLHYVDISVVDQIILDKLTVYNLWGDRIAISKIILDDVNIYYSTMLGKKLKCFVGEKQLNIDEYELEDIEQTEPINKELYQNNRLLLSKILKLNPQTKSYT